MNSVQPKFTIKNIITLIKFILIDYYFVIYKKIYSFKNLKNRLKATNGDSPPSEYCSWVGRMVYRASKFVIGSTCLTRAMSAQYILAKRNYASVVQVGVSIDENKKMIAHAWLLSGDKVIVGDEEEQLEKFTLLTEFKENML